MTKHPGIYREITKLYRNSRENGPASDPAKFLIEFQKHNSWTWDNYEDAHHFLTCLKTTIDKYFRKRMLGNCFGKFLKALKAYRNFFEIGIPKQNGSAKSSRRNKGRLRLNKLLHSLEKYQKIYDNAHIYNGQRWRETMFMGKMVKSFLCMNCQAVSSRIETFEELCVNLLPENDVMTAIKDEMEPAMLSDARCEKCKCIGRMYATCAMKTLPNILCIVLKKNTMKQVTLCENKISKFLTLFQKTNRSEIEYGLVCSINHESRMERKCYEDYGHYYTLIFKNEEIWQVNDEMINELRSGQVRKNAIQDTYILFYEQVLRDKPRYTKGKRFETNEDNDLINCLLDGPSNKMHDINLQSMMQTIDIKKMIKQNESEGSEVIAIVMEDLHNGLVDKIVVGSKDRRTDYEFTDRCKRGGIEIPQILEQKNSVKLADLIQFGDLATNDLKERMIQLCESFRDIFLLPGEKLTTTNAGVFRIETKPGATPIFRRQYRMDDKSLEKLKKFVEKLKFHDIVERSFSPYNHPVFLRPKPGLDENGEPRARMVMDFVELNKTLVPYKYPLPRIEEAHARMLNKDCFNIMDLSDSYHQFEVHEEDRHKLAFTVGNDHWQFKRGPMGISTISGLFQAMINGTLAGYVGDRCECYQDDILIKGEGVENLFESTV